MTSPAPGTRPPAPETGPPAPRPVPLPLGRPGERGDHRREPGDHRRERGDHRREPGGPFPGAGGPFPGAGGPLPGAGGPFSGAGGPFPGAGGPLPGAGGPSLGAGGSLPRAERGVSSPTWGRLSRVRGLSSFPWASERASTDSRSPARPGVGGRGGMSAIELSVEGGCGAAKRGPPLLAVGYARPTSRRAPSDPRAAHVYER